jgi:hypothetical protein
LTVAKRIRLEQRSEALWYLGQPGRTLAGVRPKEGKKMDRWECRTCAGKISEAVLYDAETANHILDAQWELYDAALQLVTEFGPSNPFPNLSAAVKKVQEVMK